MTKKLRQEPVSELAVARELSLGSTIDYEIVVETYLSPRSMDGTDTAYGVRNKLTKVIELRYGTYPDAIAGLEQAQNAYDQNMHLLLKQQGKLH